MNPPGPRIDVVQERAEPDEQAGSLTVVPDQPERAGGVRVLVERLEPAQGLGVQRRDPPRAATAVLEHRQAERPEEPAAQLLLVQAQRDAVYAPVLRRQPLHQLPQPVGLGADEVGIGGNPRLGHRQ